MHERGTYGNQLIVGLSATDKKAVGGFAVVGGLILLIAAWPKIGDKLEDRRHRRSVEKLLESHREWKRNSDTRRVG